MQTVTNTVLPVEIGCMMLSHDAAKEEGALIGIMAGCFGYALTNSTERKLHEHRDSVFQADCF